MNSKTLGILALVAAALLAIAFWVARGNAPAESGAAPAPAKPVAGSGPAAPSTAVGAKFAESLAAAAQVNSVAEISVHAAGKDVVVKRDGATWVVPTRGNYPADPEKVRDAVLSVAELTIAEAKTQKPENYSFLGVQDPEAKDSTSRLVTFKDAQGRVIVALIVGSTTPGAATSRGSNVGVYVRRAGEAQAFEVRTRLDPRATLEPEPEKWIKKDLDGVNGDRVKNVLITHADGTSVELSKTKKEDRDYAVANIPPGRELKYAGAASAVAQAISNINFDDVRPIADIAQGATPTGTAVFRTFDGLVLTIDTSTKDGTAWATLSAHYEPPNEPSPEPQPSDQPPPDAAKSKAPDEVKKEIESMNARFSGWAFALPSYRVQQLLSKMDDLLKPAEAPGAKKEPLPGPITGDEEAPPNVPDK